MFGYLCNLSDKCRSEDIRLRRIICRINNDDESNVEDQGTHVGVKEKPRKRLTSIVLIRSKHRPFESKQRLVSTQASTLFLLAII